MYTFYIVQHRSDEILMAFGCIRRNYSGAKMRTRCGEKISNKTNKTKNPTSDTSSGNNQILPNIKLKPVQNDYNFRLRWLYTQKNAVDDQPTRLGDESRMSIAAKAFRNRWPVRRMSSECFRFHHEN